MKRLQDKIIIVTGSSSGIGLGIARECVREGARVLLHGTREDQLRDAVAELGDAAQWIAADLVDPGAADAITGAAIARFGRVDGLVNNAGIFPRGSLADADPESFARIFAVNTRAPLLLCKALAAHLRARKAPGSIVNIGSINAHCGQPNLVIYSMSKGALMTMTRNLGDGLGPERIRVNQLNVGWTYTETEHATQLAEGQPEDWLDRVPAAFAPSGTLLRPENIAPHAVFFLSDASAPVTGQVYEVEQYPVIGRNKIAER